MATPRKHWFRVSDALTREPLNNDELATLVRLMGQLNQRWARDGLTAEESRSISLRTGDLMEVTGKGTLSAARRTLRSAAMHVSMSIEERGKVTSIVWPKWSEFQGLDAREQGKSGTETGREEPPPPPPPRDTPADAHTTDRDFDAPAAREAHMLRSARCGQAGWESDAEAEHEWDRFVRALNVYQTTPTQPKLTDRRRRELWTLIDEHGPDAHVESVHGYAWLRMGSGTSDHFDPQEHLNPKTLLNPDKAIVYIEGDRQAQEAGQQRPYGLLEGFDYVADDLDGCFVQPIDRASID